MGVPGRIGELQPFAELARGGATVVYKAHQPSLDRTVLLKVLRPEYIRDEEMAARFEEEARLIARIQHPNVVTIHDFGRTEEGSYFVTEYVEGTDLADLLERAGSLPVDVATGVALQAARGLQAAHERGVIHGDVKPANLMISAAGRVKLTDFGLAFLQVGDDGDDAVRGTPGYIAPELIRGEKSGPRADLFSLGVILYEALTGRTAFPGAETSDRIHAALNRNPLSRVEMTQSVADPLRRVLVDLLAKDPGDRITDADAVARRLTEAGRFVGHAGPERVAEFLGDPETYEPASGEEAGGNGEAEAVEGDVLSSLPGHVSAPVDGMLGPTGRIVASLQRLADRLDGTVGRGLHTVLGAFEQLDRSRRRVVAGVLAGTTVLVLLLVGWAILPFGSSGAAGSTASGVSGPPQEGISGPPGVEAPRRADGPYDTYVPLADTGWIRIYARPPESPSDSASTGGSEIAATSSEVEPGGGRTSPQGYIAFAVRPVPDSVRLNTVGLGTTDLEEPVPVEPGRHVVRLFHAPYPPLTDTVVVEPGETRTYEVDWSTRTAWLTISVNPWGAIELDGTARDTIPPPPEVTYVLRPGVHRAVVSNPEWDRADTLTFELAPGDTLHRSFDFLDEQ